MTESAPLLAPAAIFMLTIWAAAIAWGGLFVLSRLLPQDFLVARMREQPAGAVPVRQLGGLVIIPLYLAGLAITAYFLSREDTFIAALGAAAFALWVVGIADDRNHLPALFRLAVHGAAAGLVVLFLHPQGSLTGDALPWWTERAVLAAVLVYFINMANFMDGMDLMSVAGLGVPLIAALHLTAGGLAASPLGMSTLLLVGALAGFGFLNRPPAQIYLGDNGSLVLGLAAGTLCIHVAFDSGPVAAVLPFGYYLADSASTLALRALRGENLLAAHSGHAYQVARKAGRSHGWIVMHVVAANSALAILAGISATSGGVGQSVLAAIAGAVVSALIILRFRAQPRARQAC